MAHSTIALHRELSLAHYKRGQHLGHGGQGSVYKYTPISIGQSFAVKILEWGSDTKKRLRTVQEASVSALTDHPHVLRAYDYFLYDEGVAIVMPYFPEGDLSRVAPILNIRQLREAMRQILYALQYFHEQGQIHRDIKPKNVLIRRREPLEIVIADFGLVSIANPITTCGTAGYQAPEILQPRRGAYTEAVDIFALGVLLLECLGVPRPSPSIVDEKLHIRYIGSQIQKRMESWEDVDRRGGLLLADQMLKFRPELRLSADECLQHPWLNRWWFVPWITIPRASRNLLLFEPETRPSNNPMQAIALNLALSPHQNIAGDLVEYLAYISTNFKSFNPTEGTMMDLTEESDIAMIMSTLPQPDVVVETPPGFKQEDRMFICIAQYMIKLEPHSEKLESLSNILANHPMYRSTIAQGVTPPQAGNLVYKVNKTINKSNRTRTKGKPNLKTALGIRETLPGRSEGRDAGGHQTLLRVLVKAKPLQQEGIEDALSLKESRNAANQTANTLVSHRMEICARSRSSRRTSTNVGMVAASDRMEICSR